MSNVLDTHVAAYAGENLYDFDNEILMKWYPQRILKHAEGANSIMELGLGHGFTTNFFSQNFHRHIVLEGSSAVIQNFKERFPETRADILPTFFEEFDTSERFDLIVMGFILEHVDDPIAIMNRFRRFLATGGKLFVAVPNAEVLNRRLGVLAGMLDDIEALSDNDRLLGHKRYYTTTSLTAAVRQAGYKVDILEGIYLKPFTTRQMISLDLPENVIRALCEAGVGYPELSCGILAQLSSQ